MNLLTVKTISDYVNSGESPDILFWVGSAGSFDERAQKITRAFVKILNKANVRFAVLGNQNLKEYHSLFNVEKTYIYEVKPIDYHV